MEGYKVIRTLGQGAFGVVLRSLEKATGKEVALKRVSLSLEERSERNPVGPDAFPARALRELQALRTLDHPNVLPLLNYFADGNDIVLVCELAHCDLFSILERRRLTLQEIRGCCLQLLTGVQAVHSAQILHRDIKPSNILVSTQGSLQLADFGLARRAATATSSATTTADSAENSAAPRQPTMTAFVQTRWYRAPEILLGSTTYSFSADMWSVGCVIAELLLNAPLLHGGSDIEQLSQITYMFGALQWPGSEQLPDAQKLLFDAPETPAMAAVLATMPAQAADLIRQMLVLDPAQRLSAEQALLHPFVTAVPLPSRVLPSLLVPEQSAKPFMQL